jgi:hypothetical protein
MRENRSYNIGTDEKIIDIFLNCDFLKNSEKYTEDTEGVIPKKDSRISRDQICMASCQTRDFLV